MTQNIINVKTAIVGAGIAGIAASINLLKNNYFDFIQLEVNDRIGGRMNTQYYGKLN
jgi:spermine oxidase